MRRGALVLVSCACVTALPACGGGTGPTAPAASAYAGTWTAVAGSARLTLTLVTPIRGGVRDTLGLAGELAFTDAASGALREVDYLDDRVPADTVDAIVYQSGTGYGPPGAVFVRGDLAGHVTRDAHGRPATLAVTVDFQPYAGTPFVLTRAP